jgi:hypothetical protein
MRCLDLIVISGFCLAGCGDRLEQEGRRPRPEAAVLTTPAPAQTPAAAAAVLGSFDLELAANIHGGVAYTSAASLPVSWSDAENATGYTLRLAREGSCSGEVHAQLVAADTTSIELPELPDGEYFLCLDARGEGGAVQAALSSPFPVVIDTTAPRGFSVQTAGNQVTWDVSDEPGLSYELAVASDEDCTEIISTQHGLTTTNALLAGLEDGMYAACVTAIDRAGNRTRSMAPVSIGSDG